MNSMPNQARQQIIRLTEELTRLAPSIRKSSDRAWARSPAVKVVDCVLSLNRNYDAFVVPRLDSLEQAHPSLRSVSDLVSEIRRSGTPHDFVVSALRYNHRERAETLAGVANWLAANVTGEGDEPAQSARLNRWAVAASPSDYRIMRVKGFALAGFQYLRMLFGANTTKPDIHICRFVEGILGLHRIRPEDVLELLESAAAQSGVSLRDLDTTIWEQSARH